MKQNETLFYSEIWHGDIICFQVNISYQEVHDLESMGLYSNPQQFYKLLQSQMENNKGGESPTRLRSSQEVQNAMSGDENTQFHKNSILTLIIIESTDLDQPDTREELPHGNGIVLDIGKTTPLSKFLQDSDPEIERHISEMDNVGSSTFPTSNF